MDPMMKGMNITIEVEGYMDRGDFGVTSPRGQGGAHMDLHCGHRAQGRGRVRGRGRREG